MPYDHPNLHTWEIAKDDPYLIGYFDWNGRWLTMIRLFGHKGDIGTLGRHILSIHNATVRDEVKA